MNHLIDQARAIPVPDPGLTVSYSPVTIAAPGRPTPIELRITAPAAGDDLPIVLLSHGHGPSLYLPSKDGYGPLVNFYAERGFAVIQPTHANSKVAGFSPGAPGAPLFWRARVEELKLILDRLDAIEAALPAIAGRLDHHRIAAVGHSMGGQTVGMLLGARLTDPTDETARDVNLQDPRIKVGVLLASPGRGGDDLSEVAARQYPFLNPDFSHLTTRTLVVCGDADVASHLSRRGPDWFADAYHAAPGADALMTVHGVGHGLAGIAGYDAKETDREDPDRLEAVRRMTWAYLRSALHDGDPAWHIASDALSANARDLARIERKAT